MIRLKRGILDFKKIHGAGRSDMNFEKVFNFLGKNYPFFYGNRKVNILLSLIASGFVLHTMLVIRPDIIVSKIHTSYYAASAVYALITFTVCMIGCELPIRLFPRWFKEWKIFKELLLTTSCVLLMGILNYSYILFFGNLNSPYILDLIVIRDVVFSTFASGIVPLSLITLFNFLLYNRKKPEAARLLLLHPHSYRMIQPSDLNITPTIETLTQVADPNQPFNNFSNENKQPQLTTSVKLKGCPQTAIWIKEGNEEFRIYLSDVTIIESIGNYVKIYQTRGSKREVSVKRVTMKRMEELLKEQDILIRTHRSYFVNIFHVERISKNEVGDLSLNCRYQNIPIPVSRSRKKQVCELLKQQQPA